MADINIAKRALSRVFVTEYRARADHEPLYQGCMMMGGIEESQGDITRIQCPSPNTFNEFDDVGFIQGMQERPTTNLTALYPIDIVSTLEDLKRKRCPFDIQIIFGTCTDPTNSDEFQKMIRFDQGILTNYATDELGTLAQEDDSQINETGDVSGKEFYSIVPLNVITRGASVVTNPLNDVVICGVRQCGGDCGDENDGCQHIYATGASTPGSPGTGPDLIYSIDGGTTLAADDINSLDAGETADALACVRSYVVVVSNDDGGIHYKLKATIDAGTASGWTRNATNITGVPNDIWSVGSYAFVVGDSGYIYGLTNPVSGVVVLDAGVATTENLSAVHALNRNFAVAVGANGAVVRTEDRVTWATVTAPAAVTLQAVWLISTTVWWVGASNGAVYYTTDGGTTWTQYTGFTVTFTTVEDIAFHNDSVGYVTGAIAGPVGVVMRTYNGGFSWVRMQESTSLIPANDEVRAIAACENDVNFFAAVGLADDASDGYYVIGS
jgi:photosystem II stability/assembly factor-like uncharacterized protein